MVCCNLKRDGVLSRGVEVLELWVSENEKMKKWDLNGGLYRDIESRGRVHIVGCGC